MLAFIQIIRAELSKNYLKNLSIFRFHYMTIDKTHFLYGLVLSFPIVLCLKKTEKKNLIVGTSYKPFEKKKPVRKQWNGVKRTCWWAISKIYQNPCWESAHTPCTRNWVHSLFPDLLHLSTHWRDETSICHVGNTAPSCQPANSWNTTLRVQKDLCISTSLLLQQGKWKQG